LEAFTEIKKNDVAKPQFIDTNPNTNERPMKPEIEKNQSPPNTDTTNNKK